MKVSQPELLFHEMSEKNVNATINAISDGLDHLGRWGSCHVRLVVKDGVDGKVAIATAFRRFSNYS